MPIRKPTGRVRAYPDSDDWSEFTGQRMTVEEFMELDDREETDLEYRDGRVFPKPGGDRKHSITVGELDAWLGFYRREYGGAHGPEGRVRLSPVRYFKPDTAYYVSDTPVEDDAIPTLAVEVRSRGETLESMRRKCRMYREAGVAVCWIIDPIRRQAEVFEGERDADRLPPDGGALESSHLPGFRLALAELFSVLD